MAKNEPTATVNDSTIVLVFQERRKKRKEYARARIVAARIGGPMQLTVSTFRTDCTDKEQAKKVLEETVEELVI